MTESILNNDRACYVCGRTEPLHRHHIFYGSGYRRASEKYGCWVYLCPAHHNMSDAGVHFNRGLDIALKKRAQNEFEAIYGHDKYMSVFGRNYL